LGVTANDVDIAEEDRLRANCYALLGHLLSASPSDESLDMVRGLEGDDSDLGRDLKALSEVARHTTPQVAEEEYFNLFVGVGQGELLPYMNVWSTNEDSVLGGRRQRQAGSRTNVFQISLTLRDRQTGKTLWQGDSYCEMLTGDKLRLSRSMLPPLVSQIGQTVKDAPFEIQ